MQGQLNHRAVNQFDSGQCCRAIDIVEFDDVLGRIHRLVKTLEVHYAQHLVAWQFGQLQGQGLSQCQRAFAANQQMCQVDGAVSRVGPLALRLEDIEVVASDAAHHFRPQVVNILGVSNA